ncbi:hypothetical protein ACJZ2D_015860 [Fusarium nematophilum]
MGYSLYDASIVLAVDALNSLSSILKKASSHPNASSFPSAKLADDMLPLSFQVFIVTDVAQKIVARTTGVEPLSLDRNLDSFEAMQARIEQVLEVVGKVDRDAVNAREDEIVPVGLGPGKTVEMKSWNYINGYALPNMFFHLTTAYAILRKEGVELGKQDYQTAFLGKVTIFVIIATPPSLHDVPSNLNLNLNPTIDKNVPPLDHIVASILRRPGFHRAVGRIHKTIHEKQHGRNPHEPLAPGEATADPNGNDKSQQFAKHFLDEIKNQFRGKPTEFPGERPKK